MAGTAPNQFCCRLDVRSLVASGKARPENGLLPATRFGRMARLVLQLECWFLQEPVLDCRGNDAWFLRGFARWKSIVVATFSTCDPWWCDPIWSWSHGLHRGLLTTEEQRTGISTSSQNLGPGFALANRGIGGLGSNCAQFTDRTTTSLANAAVHTAGCGHARSQ